MHTVTTAGPSYQIRPGPPSTPLDTTRPTTSRHPMVEEIEDEDQNPFQIPPPNTDTRTYCSDHMRELNNPMTPARHVIFKLPEPPNPFRSSAHRTPATATSAAH